MDGLIWLGRIAGVIMALAYVPQQLQIVQNKSSRDVSLGMYLLVFLALAIYEAYAVWVNEPVFVVTNSMALIQVCVMLGLIWRYRRRS